MDKLGHFLRRRVLNYLHLLNLTLPNQKRPSLFHIRFLMYVYGTVYGELIHRSQITHWFQETQFSWICFTKPIVSFNYIKSRNDFVFDRNVFVWTVPWIRQKCNLEVSLYFRFPRLESLLECSSPILTRWATSTFSSHLN